MQCLDVKDSLSSLLGLFISNKVTNIGIVDG